MRALDVATAGPYNITFLLAVTVAFAIAWRRGLRPGTAASAWLAVLALTVAAGVLGARLLHFDGGAAGGAKTILGGVVLGAFALFGGSRMLRIQPRSVDALAYALPVGFAIGRVGCLLAGCCFGHPTELPWGAIYDQHSAAFRAQLAAGLIGADATASLPVHPTQIYEAILALGVLAGAPRLRRIVRRPGSLLLGVLALLATGRLVLESFRARDIASFAGLTQVQWLLAVAIACAAVLLLVRERRSPRALRTVTSPPGRRVFLVAFAAPALIVTAGPWLAPLERIAILLAAAPSLIALASRAVRYLSAHEPALAVPALVPCAALLLAMQQAPDSLRSAYPRAEWSLGLSAGASNDREERVVDRILSDCGGFVDVYEPYEVNRRVGGASLAYTRHTSADRSSTIRLRGFAGRERSRAETNPADVQTVTLGGVGPSLTLDFRWVGLTAGFAAGRLSSDTLRSEFVGTGGLRIGRLDSVHAFAGINDLDPIGHSESVTRLGVGYGLPNGSAVRVGIWRGDVPFVGGTVAIGGFQLEPSIVFGNEYDVRFGVSRSFPLNRE